MKLKPLRDQVLVELIDTETTTPGGIIIPDTAKQKPSMGKVIAKGPGAVYQGNVVPIDLNVGDTVLFGRHATNEVEDNMVLLHEDQILGVVQ